MRAREREALRRLSAERERRAADALAHAHDAYERAERTVAANAALVAMNEGQAERLAGALYAASSAPLSADTVAARLDQIDQAYALVKRAREELAAAQAAERQAADDLDRTRTAQKEAAAALARREEIETRARTLEARQRSRREEARRDDLVADRWATRGRSA